MRTHSGVLLSLTLLAVPVHAQHRPPGGPPLPDGLPLFMSATVGLNLRSDVVALGRDLFFDTRLSRDGRVACATCHDPARAFTDGRSVSVGVNGRRGTRSAPTLVNRAYGESQFWDGRVTALLEQVLHPIEHPDELGLTRAEAAARVAADASYVTRVRRAFGDVAYTDALARALAAYVATILSGNAPYDRYTAGDTLALSAEARHGRRLFDGRARCSTCHRGPNFTDEQFHNTGVAWRNGVATDSGRFTVTRHMGDVGAFKTPTLREIARTAPYMHNGSLATLEEVIDFYDRGGFANPYIDAELRPLLLSEQDKRALVTFLRTLTGQVREGAW